MLPKMIPPRALVERLIEDAKEASKPRTFGNRCAQIAMRSLIFGAALAFIKVHYRESRLLSQELESTTGAARMHKL
ncbi:hypothetical protein BS78_10G211200 [Paspalum vaginatum]|nr:hypothetical protein BS78_10G211200 [Paspalum vaginatum]